jgi:YD repeat-containing protein
VVSRKLSAGKSFSAVKNLPDAETLRNKTEAAPEIPAPIASTACLISTVNCPANRNHNNLLQKRTSISSSLSGILQPGSVSNATGFSFDNLLAFHQPGSDFFASDNPTAPEELKPGGGASDRAAGADNFFAGLKIYNASAPTAAFSGTSALLLPPGGNGKIFDFDGDGKADVSVWRPDTGEWFVLRSSDSNFMVQSNFGLGALGERIVPGNYDGDTKTDYAYWRQSTGVWTIKQSSNNQIVTYTLGKAGDIPVPGDFDGDGKVDVAVFRPSSGSWQYRKSSDGTTQTQQWGQETDVPVTGDFDGDGKTDFAVVRASDTNWYILQSSNGMNAIQWGAVGDRLVPGDYDGDGKTDAAVWRASDNTWYIRKSSTGVMQALAWGISADYPVPADYDGDGKTDIAIWRTSTGGWWISKSIDGSQYYVPFGAAGDIPLPVSYVSYFSLSNQSPVAEAGGPYTAAVNTAIQLDGRGSTDADGQIYGYNWNFGDGTTGTGGTPSHIYSSPGTYTVSLTVTDNQGFVSSSDTSTVTVIAAAAARLDPFNAVGNDNIISRNFNWKTGLAGFPGRAGLTTGISLSYNSLVWVKQSIGANSYMVFDPDNGFPGPGFRMGMPVIEKRHFNSETGKYGYLMITESGSRVEFRQVLASNIYETADSSYTQLIDSGTSLLVRLTDGTQYSYQLLGNSFQCVQVKDNNGNFVTFSYNSFNRLSQITDTLGRVLAVNYDAYGNPLSIAQNYSGGQRIYATFGYELKTINTNFSGMTVIGPKNNSQITVLKQVGFDDGSYYQFNYNTYGQVYQIDSFAADGHKLNHIKYNLESPGTQSDCPRFTVIESYAEDWTTATTSIEAPVPATWTMPDTNQSESGLVSAVTAPNGVTDYYYYHSQGWDKALPMLSETWATVGSLQVLTRQRWATTRLTQDDTTLSYPKNPRLISKAVGDSGSTRKSSISYTSFTLPSGTVMSLPNDSLEYNSDGTTVYRHGQIDYNFNSEYVNRYIIGLPSETRVYAGAGTSSLQDRTSFGYDEETLNNLPNIIQHDSANYGASSQWRANLTSVRRWNAINASESTVNRTGYNIAGTPAWTQDPVQDAAHRQQVSYNDNFSDGINRNTYAYPTTVTDPDGYTANSKYHFLNGLVSEIQGPRAGQTSNSVRGVISKTYYDAIDRRQKTETLLPDGTPTGAYTRYEYLDSMKAVKTFTKLDGTLAEAYMLTVLDGHGRTRASAMDLPNSTGGYSGRIFLYDNMGRNWKTALPAETSAAGNPNGWTATGDDAANGWLYTTETFDWKGRVLKTTNTDGTTKERFYYGCGCAGGNTVVLRDEIGRRQKLTFDIFGRPYKSQALQIQPKSEPLNGSGVPYTTTIETYNIHDQLLSSTIHAETETSNIVSQQTTVEYDGYGRIWKNHQPEQKNSSGAPLYSEITYYNDDTIQSVKDARGTIRTLTYGYRKQLLQASYTTVGNIPAVSPTTFQYDALGNRTSMVDEEGSLTFTFNMLSQLTQETRVFSDINRTISRNYTYNGASLLTGVLDPDGNNLLNATYEYDKTGRLTQVNGGGYGNLPQNQPLISNITYRAFGALKQQTQGNGLNLTMEYNNRLQPSRYELKNSSNQMLMAKTYQYETSPNAGDNDGRVKQSTDLVNSKLTRKYTFDFVGRMSSAKAGNTIVSNNSANGYTDGPFEQTYIYNHFSNMAQDTERIWFSNGFCTNCPSIVNHYQAPIDNRNTYPGWSYDDDGRLAVNPAGGTNQYNYYTYDAMGRLRLVDEPNIDRRYDYDGNGERLSYSENGVKKVFYFKSSVIGKDIVELNGAGNVIRSYVYTPAGQRIAKQENLEIIWHNQDVAGESARESDIGGSSLNSLTSPLSQRVELDPLGNDTNNSSAYNYSGSTTDNNGSPTSYYNYGNAPHGASWWMAFVDVAGMIWSSGFPQLVGWEEYYTRRDGTPVVIPHNAGWDTSLAEGAYRPVYQTPDVNFLVLNYLNTATNTVTPPEKKCRDVIGLSDQSTEEGALARLAFLEATDFQTFFKGIYPTQWSRDNKGKLVRSDANVSEVGLQTAYNLQMREMQAVVATVYNIQSFIQTYPSSSYPDAAYTGFPSSGNLLDIIYSKGGRNTQYEGFSTDAAGNYAISKSKSDKIENALNSNENSASCSKLRSALNAARDIMRDGVPDNLKGVVGIRTANTGSSGKNYEKAFQLDWSGNIFYRFRQSYIDSILKSSQRVRRR